MYIDIIDFWFNETTAPFWFKKDKNFDNTIRQRFGKLHQQATSGELWIWREHPLGRLAEIIILDQFSRNLYRDKPLAFAYDGMALVLAQQAVLTKSDADLEPKQKAFLYMPFMHSESKQIHEWAVTLFQAPGLEDNYQYELKHRAIIEQFGHYPHRNASLNRPSTPEEIEFLKTEGSSF